MQAITILTNNNEFGRERIVFSHINQPLSPERAVFDSPGCSKAEPWVKKTVSCQALKGRYKINVDVMAHGFISPIQGLIFAYSETQGVALG